MKKSVILSLFSLILLTSCGSSYTFETPSIEHGGLFNYVHDENMILDGKNDEEVYKNLEKFEIYEPQYGVSVSTQTYFGENGFYIYSHSDDKNIFANTEFDIFANDGIEMHICVDPKRTTELENLKKSNQIDDTMLQIRTDVNGRLQTWVGNYLQGGYYEWTMYFVPCQIATFIDGKINKPGESNGFGIEFFIPYKGLGLDGAPEEISIMPAFNNSASNLVAERKWFTFKGMSHNKPSSWIKVNKDGYIYEGKDKKPKEEIVASSDDEKFLEVEGIELIEVNEKNQNLQLRAKCKSFLDETGIYYQYTVFDKELSQHSDVIWANDGVEFYIDTALDNDSNHLKTGVYRFGFDIDNGVQTDKCLDGYNDSYPYLINTVHKTSITEIVEYSDYGYKYLYVYEIFVPYESIGLTYKENMEIKTSFAINSPGESTYILDRKNGNGIMEAANWLWVDKHFPKNCFEYYTVTEEGIFVYD